MTNDANEAGGRWLDSKLGRCTPEVLGAVAWDRAGLVEIFAAGASWAEEQCSKVHRAEQDEWCIERATGQRQLDEALVLIAEAAKLFTHYGEHHKARASDTTQPPEQQAESLRKAMLNMSMALSLREYIAAADATLPLDEAVAVLQLARRTTLPPNVLAFPGVTSREQAERHPHGHRANLRAITSGPLADPAVVEGLAAVIEPGEAATPLSTIRAHGFQLHTGDPRFDPTQPVLINGYPFTPTATEQ